MTDDKPIASGKDNSLLSDEEEHEVLHLAETTDLSPNQARELIRRHGNDRAKLMEMAKTFKAES